MGCLPLFQVLVLAAGSSTRFGSDKRYLTLLPVLTTIFAALEQKMLDCICVLRARDAPDTAILTGDFNQHPRLHKIWNDEPERGMGYSLALGAVNLHADAVMVFLGDMPYIHAETIITLSGKLTDNSIVVPVCNGRPGHPVCFGREFFAELRLLDGDVGAKKLLDRHQEAVVWVEVPDSGIWHDIDYPSDILP